MRRTITIITILILGLAFGVQDKRNIVRQSISFANDNTPINLTIPKNMNFQGTLYQDGSPVTDTMDIWFGIYDALSGGTLLYSVTNTNVAVINGWFSTILTNIPNSVFPVTGPTRYLEIKAPATGSALTPRLELASVGYSYHSITADTAEYAKSGAGSSDNDWVRGTPDSVLFTIRPLGIARGGTNNMLYGSNRFTHVNLGVACTTGTYGSNDTFCTVSGGLRNKATRICATVGGGRFNTASGYDATVGAGYFNTASGNWATVAGGQDNIASAVSATVGGGGGNRAYFSYTTVGGGELNIAYDDFTTVSGGYYNLADNENATVGGGYKNRAGGFYATIPGGYADTANGPYSLAAGNQVKITSAANNTFAFGNNFSTSTPNAVVFHNTVNPIKVGIGTSAPETTLHIVGNIKMVDGNQALGKFLVSDANGVGSWQTSSISRPLTPPLSGTEIAKPCTLKASVSGAVLEVKNTHASGTGIGVDSAGWVGVGVNRVGAAGLWVGTSGWAGLDIDSVAYDGVYINRAGNYGVNVHRAGVDGVYIDSAGGDGVKVNRAGGSGFSVMRPQWTGFYVDSAHTGFHIPKAGQSGVRVNRSYWNGVWIDKADNIGLRVDSAGWDGAKVYRAYASGYSVDRAGMDGVFVDSVGNCGFYVNRADTGLRVYRAKYNGVHIDSAGINGVYIDSVGSSGVSVRRANDNGVYVGKSGLMGVRVVGAVHGIQVDSASTTGIRILRSNNTGVAVLRAVVDGVSVARAGENGVYVDSAGHSGGYFRNYNNDYYTLTAVNNTGTGASTKGLYVQGNGYATGGWSTFLVDGKAGFSLTSPDLEIVTSGSGSLTDGASSIIFEKTFQEAFSNNVPLKVIVTPTSRCNGICVEEKSATGFTVEEVMSGKSNSTFDWIAIGRMKGYEQRPDIKPMTEEMRKEDDKHQQIKTSEHKSEESSERKGAEEK